MSWKYGVKEKIDSKPCFNAVAFATREEAERAGDELLSRWLAPVAFEVVESDEPVNYEFHEDWCRPRPISRDGGDR